MSAQAGESVPVMIGVNYFRYIVRSETDLQLDHLLNCVDRKVSSGNPSGDRSEQVASVERARQIGWAPDNSPGLRFRGARRNQGQETVVRPYIPFVVRLKDHGIAIGADARIDHGQENMSAGNRLCNAASRWAPARTWKFGTLWSRLMMAAPAGRCPSSAALTCPT